MKEVFGAIAVAFVGLFVVVGVVFGLGYAGYLGTSFFAPRYEAVRRNTMTQSRAYVEDETRNLYRLKLQYQEATTLEAKQTLVLAIRHECDSVDRSTLPADVAAICTL